MYDLSVGEENDSWGDEGALKLFGNRFLNKCGGVSHFHNLPLQF